MRKSCLSLHPQHAIRACCVDLWVSLRFIHRCQFSGSPH